MLRAALEIVTITYFIFYVIASQNKNNFLG